MGIKMKKIIIFSIVYLLIGQGICAFCSEAKLFKLDNGQTVVLQEVKNNPIVTIDTWIKTGSIDEDDSNNGVAHFLEHLFFKGTSNMAPGEFDRILENKGAVTNAATSKDFTHYYITIPSKDFDLALKLHSDMMLNPLVLRNEMEKERKVVLEEINKDLNSPHTLLYDNLNSMLYSNHPYKRRVIGKSEIIETISRDNVLKFFNAHYAPSNMVTVIIGDIDSDDVLEKVKASFKTDAKNIIKYSYPKEFQLTEQKKKVAYADVQTGYMIIGFRGVSIKDKDSYALDVLSTILGEGKSSVLNQLIKEKKRLAFEVGAGNSTYKDDGIFYVNATFEPDKCKQIQDEVFSAIENIKSNGITDDQLNLAKGLIERSTYYSRESVSNISSEIGYTVALTDDLKFYDNYLNNINKVTKEDVLKVARKYLGENKSAVSIVLPENAKNVPVAVKKKTDSSFELVNKNNQTQKYKLSNGAVLLYSPNDYNDIIAMSIYSKGGQLLSNTFGISTLSASAMMKGTKNYSETELSSVMEERGIKISPKSTPDGFVISVLTTKDQYEKTLELLNEVVNNAILDESEINKIKSNKLNEIKASKDSALTRALEKYRDLIYPDSNYSISGLKLEKTVSKISRNDILNYYNKIFDPQNMVISINGNVDLDKTVNDLNEIFKQKQNSVKFDYQDYSSKIYPITKSVNELEKMPSTQTAWIILGWQTCGVLDKKDYASLEVIDSLLGTGMSSRMFKDLREKEGLAYQLGSSFSANVLRGNLLMYIGTNPSTLERSKQGLFNEINKLKTEYVSDKELKEAKDKLLGHYIIGLETNLEKASVLSWYESSGRGYEFKDEYESLINSVTSADIMRVANKYFNENYVLTIVTN